MGKPQAATYAHSFALVGGRVAIVLHSVAMLVYRQRSKMSADTGSNALAVGRIFYARARSPVVRPLPVRYPSVTCVQVAMHLQLGEYSMRLLANKTCGMVRAGHEMGE